MCVNTSYIISPSIIIHVYYGRIRDFVKAPLADHQTKLTYKYFIHGSSLVNKHKKQAFFRCLFSTVGPKRTNFTFNEYGYFTVISKLCVTNFKTFLMISKTSSTNVRFLKFSLFFVHALIFSPFPHIFFILISVLFSSCCTEYCSVAQLCHMSLTSAD